MSIVRTRSTVSLLVPIRVDYPESDGKTGGLFLPIVPFKVHRSPHGLKWGAVERVLTYASTCKANPTFASSPASVCLALAVACLFWTDP